LPGAEHPLGPGFAAQRNREPLRHTPAVRVVAGRRACRSLRRAGALPGTSDSAIAGHAVTGDVRAAGRALPTCRGVTTRGSSRAGLHPASCTATGRRAWIAGRARARGQAVARRLRITCGDAIASRAAATRLI